MDGQKLRTAYYSRINSQTKADASVLESDFADLRKVTELVAGAELQLPQRVRAWQLLLRIAAVSSDTADAVAQQRQTQYEDLRDAVAVLEPSLNVPPVDPEKRLEHEQDVVVAMIMLDLCATDSEHLRKHLRRPCRMLVEQSLSLTLRPSPLDAFWFGRMLLQRIKPVQPFLRKEFMSLLKREDCRCHDLIADNLSEDELLALEQRWFLGYFVGCFPEDQLLKIWDYLIAGSVPFHLTFAASIVLTCKPQLMKRKKGTDVCKILFQVISVAQSMAVRPANVIALNPSRWAKMSGSAAGSATPLHVGGAGKPS